MKETLAIAFRVLIPLILLGVVCLSCFNGRKSAESSNNVPKTQPQVEQDNDKIGGFPTGEICSLPQKVAVGGPFASLGGGIWGKWKDTGGETDFGCNGGKDMIEIVKRTPVSDDLEIIAEFGVIGGKTKAHYISVEYDANQYNGLSPEERKYREQYADFCDKMSLRLYGTKMPAKFRKRLLDDSAYAPAGSASEYAEKVGNGFLGLSSTKNKTMMILLDVQFFASEEEYQKYKDS